MRTKAKGKNNLNITIKEHTRELEEYLLEEEKPIQPEQFYQEMYGTRDEFIRTSIKINY